MKKLLFFVASLVFSAVLIFTSEKVGFSHLNLIPFGGESWALWSYPLCILFSFLLFSLIFKIHNKIQFISILAIVIFILFFIVFQGTLFANPMPFNK
jgi:hypothetical protein